MKTTLRHSSQFLAILCILAVTFSGCSRSPAKATPTDVPIQAAATNKPVDTPLPSAAVPTAYWPTGGWRTSTPEEQGMDSAKLTQMLDEIHQKGLRFHSLLVIRHGYLVSETYFGSYKQDTQHELYSCTKSFVSTLIGIAIDKGFIDGTDHLVLDFFPDRKFTHLDDQKRAMTLDDLLTMRTGLDWKEADASFNNLYQSSDWVTYMFDLPMAQAPGAQFLYCSGCSHILSAIIEETTGKGTRAFAEQNLFKPLGISKASWSTSPAGTPIGGWGLQITPRDMAKLGYLFLHQGQWDGQQIVSAGWVQNATQSHTGTGGALGYGYQWWTYPTLNAYAALGLYGQMIFVIPGSDLVIVSTAGMDNHDQIFRLIEQYIVSAVK